MRTFTLILFLFLAAAGAGFAAEAAPQPHAGKPADATPVDAVTISPHRAIYDMNLSSVKNGSSITDVSGTMVFEWADACDGWAIQQNMKLHFTHAEGDESSLSSNEVTWESKDGKRYNFNIRHLNDGKETELYRGKANIAGPKPAAVYSIPEDRVTDLTAETLFPSAHTRLIIAKALSGDHFFTRRVFDGTDEAGQDDVSVFIGAMKAHADTASLDSKLAASPLLAASEWPVHMAFFKLDDETGEPDYEMDLSLLSNGVARSMHIDYGDFSVTGTLKAIEPLPTAHCP